MTADLLLRQLLAEQGIQLDDRRGIRRRDPGAEVPATSAQRRLWFLEKVAPDGPEYLISTAFRLTGEFDVDRFTAALEYLWRRHEPLRTALAESGGRLVQQIASADDIDLVPRVVPAELKGRSLHSVLDEHTSRPMSLDQAPLWRVGLTRLAGDEHCVQFTVHHTICDAAGLDILIKDLFEAYNGHTAEPLPVQFADFALSDEPNAAAEAYWRQTLANAPRTLDLPTDLPRPPVRSGRGAGYRFGLPLADGIAKLKEEHGYTTHTILLAALLILLSRYSQQDDVVVGVPIDNRMAVGTESMVGMMVSTVAVRADLTGDRTVAQLLADVHQACLDAIEHADVPFERLVELAGVNPLFSVMMVHEHAGAGPPVVPGLAIEQIELGYAPAHFDLTVRFVEQPDALHGRVDYSLDLFCEDTIARMAGHLRTIVEAMTGDVGRAVGAIDLVDAGELSFPASYDEPPCVLDEIRPSDAVAVIEAGRQISYRQLVERANAVAARLRDMGAGPETRIGLGLRSGLDGIVGLLGIMRAGGAYLPLDPTYPPDRLAYMLRDSGCSTVVTTAEHAHLFDCQIVDVAAQRAAEYATTGTKADQLAYVIYTSGTSGAPKGVMVEHGSLRHLTRHYRDIHGFGPEQRILMVPPLTFDASVADVFAVLTSGAALALHERPGELSGPDLLEFCARHGITGVDAPAALWRRWTEDLPAAADIPLTSMMVGGESVSLEAVRNWAERTGGRVSLFNHYGPTEATVCATTYRTVDGSEVWGTSTLPIGWPLPHVRAYVLDQAGRPCPIGVPGQLYLGGPCVARGYLNQPELTAKSFPCDPFAPGRMYATGDQVRYRSDGHLEFLGRVDRQLKVSGHRVEPAEIETACAGLAGVSQAVAGMHGDQLVAWLVADTGERPSGTRIRAGLKQVLPAYTVPAQFVWVDSIPLTRHGKIDFTALPAPVPETAEGPGSSTESAVVAIVSELVGHTEIRPTDTFFDVGGTSLVTPRLRDLIAERLGPRLALRVLFEQSLAGIASLVDEEKRCR